MVGGDFLQRAPGDPRMLFLTLCTKYILQTNTTAQSLLVDTEARSNIQSSGGSGVRPRNTHHKEGIFTPDGMPVNPRALFTHTHRPLHTPGQFRASSPAPCMV